MIVRENVSLKHFNTFRIDVNARYFVEISDTVQLKALLAKYEMPFIVGGGSNILLTQDIDNLVIHNKIMGIQKISETDEHVILKVGAGENWHQFVLYCLAHDYAGIENLSLIPGSVGAAPIQNIGAYGVEIKDTLVSVDYVLVSDTLHPIKTIANQDCNFGYRDSIFKHELKGKIVITHVTFKLNKTPVFHLDYGAIREKLNNQIISIQTISNAIINIRKEKLPDPAVIGNAGSFFKNPIITKDVFEALQKKYPHIPHFSEDLHHVKIPAGWLIEQCGFKGQRYGDIGIHANQALVLVNYGNGTGKALLDLCEKIQTAVFKSFGLQLLAEVNIY